MPLTRLKFRPGIDRSNTNYANEGGFYACDKVRFRSGSAQKIGGWVKYVQTAVVGSVRNLFNWVSLDSTNLLAIGTNAKYYVEHAGTLHDVTPWRATATLTNPFAVTLGSTTVTVTHTAHGAANGDYVNISNAAQLGGIPASDFNQEFSIVYVNANTYQITVNTPAGSTVTGGGTVTAGYQITVGRAISTPGRGWGAGSWSRGTWGSAATQNLNIVSLRQWSQEAFGEDHIFCVRNDKLWLWRYNSGAGYNTRAVDLAAQAGAYDVPLMASKLLMSTADRHLIAFGCNAVGTTTQDPLLIRWANTESYLDWSGDGVVNHYGGPDTSGFLRCSSGNYISTAIRYNNQILVFTDSTVYGMQFIGAPYIFGMLPVADNISIMSPQCVAVAGSNVFWMGTDKFYVFNGQVQTLTCTLMNLIFDDINMQQQQQVFAGTNEGFSEVWWFYCSANSSTIDRYVVFNYVENLWYYGTMHRTAWLDSHLKQYPLAAMDSTIYYHEFGTDDDRLAPIDAWLESSDISLGEGDEFCFVNRILPDVDFTGSPAATPAVTITLTPRNTPGGAYFNDQTGTVTNATVLPYEQFTERLDVRLRGRQLKFRIESNNLGVQWQLGVPRIDVKPDGKK